MRKVHFSPRGDVQTCLLGSQTIRNEEGDQKTRFFSRNAPQHPKLRKIPRYPNPDFKEGRKEIITFGTD